jgi:hypothetical protein
MSRNINITLKEKYKDPNGMSHTRIVVAQADCPLEDGGHVWLPGPQSAEYGKYQLLPVVGHESWHLSWYDVHPRDDGEVETWGETGGVRRIHIENTL